MTVFINLEPDKKEDLFETELELIDTDENTLKDLGAGKQEIIDIKGKKNKVAVGRPQCINILDEFKKHNENLNQRIKDLSNRYDFRLIILSCSFRPDADCKFEKASFDIRLFAKTKGGQLSDQRPIGYDTFPERLLAETKIKREVGFTPEAKISATPLEVGATGTVSHTTEFIVYTPEIFSYGVGTGDLSWDFRKSKQNELVGDKKNLLIVVQTPKGSDVVGRFTLSAKVSSPYWSKIPSLRRKVDREPINEEHVVCEGSS